MSSSLEVVEFLAGAEVISMRVGRMLHAVLLLLVADVSARRVRNHGCARMGGRSHFDMASPHYSVSAVFGASQTSGVNTGPLHGPVSPDYGKII